MRGREIGVLLLSLRCFFSEVALALLNETASQVVMFSIFFQFVFFYPSQSLLILTISY